jgi:hypothetical protein
MSEMNSAMAYKCEPKDKRRKYESRNGLVSASIGGSRTTAFTANERWNVSDWKVKHGITAQYSLTTVNVSPVPVAITVVAPVPVVAPVALTVPFSTSRHATRSGGAGGGIGSRGRERGWGKSTLFALFFELLEHAAEFVVAEVHLDESDVRYN